jgi:hypothetical protein
MIELARRKLGRLPYEPDPRTLRLASFRTGAAAGVPVERRWDRGIEDWGLAGNDRYGNCVVATAAHMLLGWRWNASEDRRAVSDAEVVKLSWQMGALNGYTIIDRLKWWRKKTMWGNRLWMFAGIDPAKDAEVREAVDVFGAADVGVNLPRAWQVSEVWDVGSGRGYEPGSWGGHSVTIEGYDSEFLYLVTWGEIVAMTYAAMHRYVDEAYGVIDPSWLARQGTTPSGYDLAAMHAALAVATSTPREQAG